MALWSLRSHGSPPVKASTQGKGLGRERCIQGPLRAQGHREGTDWHQGTQGPAEELRLYLCGGWGALEGF